MRILFIWGLATAIAAMVSAAKAARHRQRRRAIITFAAALACIASVCFILIRHGNVFRPAEPVEPSDEPVRAHSAPATTNDGVRVSHETIDGDSFTVVTLDLRHTDLELFWKRPDGTSLGTFAALADEVRRHGRRLLFATNSGIFDPSFTPCGLHIDSFRQMVPLNLDDGEGNFYLKPNGVFWVDVSDGAHIVDSTRYSGATPTILLATQSGPMLVINGQINPQFAPQSPNRKLRSGVGVSPPSTIHFVLSDQPVTFHALAAVFRTRLGCRDALYLDGVISRFYLPGRDQTPPTGNFAGMFAVIRR